MPANLLDASRSLVLSVATTMLLYYLEGSLLVVIPITIVRVITTPNVSDLFQNLRPCCLTAEIL